jgi:hypothetical protein
MSPTKARLLEFLRLHRHAVQASRAADGAPQAALVWFVVNDRLELFFDSFDSTRKVANLRSDPRIALVIGGNTTGNERTVQYEGVVDTPTGAELEQFQRDYFAALPDGRRRSKLPGITYFRVRPRWIRFGDYNVAPPQIVVFEGAALHSSDTSGAVSRLPYFLQGTWERDTDHEPRECQGGADSLHQTSGAESCRTDFRR